jgi:UMF1 family MFS transporter
MLKRYREIPETFRYLAAWFIMSDAFATITSTAVLFAKITLGMQAQQLIWVGVLTPVCGIAGALAWPKFQDGWLRTTDLATLRIIVALSAVVGDITIFFNGVTKLTERQISRYRYGVSWP